MRYSGHEWFPCRYSWLPKACALIENNSAALSDDELAVTELGIGKNMVRALRFWAIAMNVIQSTDDGYIATPFGTAVFGKGSVGDEGHDPYLEDVRTLWLLHWNVSTADDPLFAWDFMLNRWHKPEIVRGVVLPEFIREANSGGRTYSEVTLRQHFDVFMQVYVTGRPTRAGAGEDHLDSPLAELGLFEAVGERMVERKREPVYVFRPGPKPEVSAEMFAYALCSFWSRFHASDRTLSFRDVALAPGSPGRVFRLSEAEVRDRLERIGGVTDDHMTYRESAALPQVERSESTDVTDPDLSNSLLERVYAPTSDFALL